MEVIEFRAKSLMDNQWVYGGYFKHLKRTPCPIGDFVKEEDYEHLILRSGFSDWNMLKPVECIAVQEKTVGQFIGLKDKYGKKIYEGDIVDFKYGTGVVKYDMCAFRIDGFWRLENVLHSVEVIGNIHDDIQLLQAKHNTHLKKRLE